MNELEKKELLEKIDTVLDTVRPALDSDGGDIDIVDLVDGILYVELKGNCDGCPSSTMTLKMGIERILVESFPDSIKSVESV